MIRSSTRILTTHTGSLARPAELRQLLAALATGDAVDKAAFAAACGRAVDDAVRQQCAAGLDIVNDGDMPKMHFARYIRERLDGFEGPPIHRVASLEARDFPEAAGGVQWQYPCTGPVSWKDFSLVQRDIANLQAATRGLQDKHVFMTSVSPGSITNQHPNRFYAKREQYLAAAVDAMRREYEAIAAAGFLLQVDSPDLAQHSYNFPDLSVAQWRHIVAENVEAVNAATSAIPREQLRVHVCWGANEGPHNHDTELKDIIDLILGLRCSAVSIVCANGRHQHEWRLWEGVKLPEGMSVIPGVIDSTTNIVEHPQTVAERLIRFGRVLGREKVMAGVDCGFGTDGIAAPRVDPKVALAKLRSLVEGAALASRELWPG